jgi:hypothetical protein
MDLVATTSAPSAAALAPRIPHVLHQSWRSRQLPRGLRDAVRSWRALQPNWTYKFHTDDDNRAIISEHLPWLAPAFARMSAIQRADVARYAYMHVFGGVYADLDVQLLQPLRPLLHSLRVDRNASVILGSEPLAHAVLLEGKRRQVCNAVLASVPGHPFWLHVLRRHVMVGFRGGADPVGSTGPRMLERAVEEWVGGVGVGGIGGGISSGGVHVVAPDVFFPSWDPMQAGTLQRKCTSVEILRAAVSNPSRRLVRLRREVCARLRKEGFKPDARATREHGAFTNHLWTHTWIPGAQKVSLADTYALEP